MWQENLVGFIIQSFKCKKLRDVRLFTRTENPCLEVYKLYDMKYVEYGIEKFDFFDLHCIVITVVLFVQRLEGFTAQNKYQKNLLLQSIEIRAC